MTDTIKSTIMRRDGLTSDKADRLIEEAQEELETAIEEGCSLDTAEQIIADYFSLEPDYLVELLP